MSRVHEPIKLVFLDIDGVICCNAYGRLEEPKLELLKHVCQRTGAKVILSTDWRRVPQLKAQLISTLKTYGLQCIGATPCRPNWLAVRPEEIVAWMKGYATAPNAADKPPIGTWVAVDDRPLLQEQGGDELRGHFVRTKLAVGLTERLAQRMIDVLNGDPSQADPAPTPQAHGAYASPHLAAADASSSPFGTPASKPAPIIADSRRAALVYSSAGSSGYQTPPPVVAHGPASFAHGAPADDAKAAAVRAYASGRGVLAPKPVGAIRRPAVGAPPRFAGAAGRSPAHVGGPAAGSAQWWSSRGAAGVSSGAGGPTGAGAGTGAGVSPARGSPASVYGTAGAPRPRFAH